MHGAAIAGAVLLLGAAIAAVRTLRGIQVPVPEPVVTEAQKAEA